MKTTRSGVFYALAAYSIWGLLPIYWKWLLSVGHLEILAHRVIWATLSFSILLLVRTKHGLRKAFTKARPILPSLVISASLIAVNWGIYIHAVNSGNVLESSLGYFTNPLVSVFLGWAILGEKLSQRQWLAVALAGAGVIQLAIRGDHFPTVAISLAVSFGLYGLTRKRMKIEPLLASSVEAALLAPVALVYVMFLASQAGPTLGHPLHIWALLVASGAVTAFPLLWFAEATHRLKLSTIGFFQYITPTLQFALAVHFGEPFTSAYAKAFACIWCALAIFSIDLALGSRRVPAPAS